MVVQCPNCQSRFRVANEKVSERGVRVRCSACKNVFAVRKPSSDGSTGTEKKRGASGEVVQVGAPTGSAIFPVPTDHLSAPTVVDEPLAGKQTPSATAAKRRPSPDPFGMSELTGESAPPRAADPLPTPAQGDPLALGRTATPRPGVSTARVGAETTPAGFSELLPERTSVLAPTPAKAEEADPFEGLSLTDNSLPAAAARASSPTTPVDRTPPRIAYASARRPTDVPRTSARRELVASVLTGLVGAALALAIMLVATLESGTRPAWLSLGGVSDVVATHVRSGLYDTAGGKPVFFVRGKVENRGKTVRGPIRVVAELVGRAGADARAEAIAGAEPSPEDVHALRSAGDADKLARALAGSEGDHRVQPGASLPFFAIIADPPANLSRHKLVVRLEPLESPSAPRSAEGPR